MKKTVALLLAVLLLTGCSRQNVSDNTPESTGSNAAAQIPAGADPSDLFSDRDYKTDYTQEQHATVTFDNGTITASTNAVKISGTKAEIIEAGTYVLTGALNDGQVIVNGEKTDKIHLVLSGVQLTSKSSAPLYIKQADKVFITTAKDTENTLSNGGSFESTDDTNIDAVIFSKSDVTLNGEGTLAVTSPTGHGIVSKDDLVVTGGSYQVDAAGHGLCGKDSVCIDGGVFALTTGKDGVHAENNEDTASGFGYIGGGTFTIKAEGDGVSASGALEIVGGDFTVTAGGGNENGTKANSGNYGGFGGGRPSGMGRPGSMGGMPQTETNTDTESTSMKGIKAAGDLTVRGGTFTIDSADDAVHSNGNLALAGGSFTVATGDDGFHADARLDITAGTVTISKCYEGLEGLHIAVSGGDISLVASDDGLNAAGGNDGSGTGGRDQMFPGGKGGFGGMSAGNGSITISGGKLYVQASGDGIDANGTLEITGGYTVVCGPTQGDTATLDYDKTAVISGGTFIGTGAAGMAQSFSGSEGQGVIARQMGETPAITQIVVKDSKGRELISYTPKLNFRVVILSSPDIQKGESYTVTIGEQSEIFQAK